MRDKNDIGECEREFFLNQSRENQLSTRDLSHYKARKGKISILLT